MNNISSSVRKSFMHLIFAFIAIILVFIIFTNIFRFIEFDLIQSITQIVIIAVVLILFLITMLIFHGNRIKNFFVDAINFITVEYDNSFLNEKYKHWFFGYLIFSYLYFLTFGLYFWILGNVGFNDGTIMFLSWFGLMFIRIIHFYPNIRIIRNIGKIIISAMFPLGILIIIGILFFSDFNIHFGPILVYIFFSMAFIFATLLTESGVRIIKELISTYKPNWLTQYNRFIQEENENNNQNRSRNENQNNPNSNQATTDNNILKTIYCILLALVFFMGFLFYQSNDFTFKNTFLSYFLLISMLLFLLIPIVKQIEFFNFIKIKKDIDEFRKDFDNKIIDLKTTLLTSITNISNNQQSVVNIIGDEGIANIYGRIKELERKVDALLTQNFRAEVNPDESSSETNQETTNENESNDTTSTKKGE